MAISATVKTVWTLVNRVTGPAREIKKQFDAIHKSASSARVSIRGLVGQLAAVAGVSAGLGGIAMLVRDMVRLNTEMEATTLGMGGLVWQLQSLSKTKPFASLTDAVKYGKQVFSDFEEYAKNAAGSSEDYIQTWQNLLTPMATAGATLQQIRHTTKMLVPEALALGVNTQSASFAIMQMSLGMARSQNVFVMTLLKMGGYTVKTWNELVRRNPKKAMAELVRMLDLGKDAAKAYGNTMASQLATVHDNIMQLKRAIGHELWLAIKKVAVQFNEFMTQKDKIKEFARAVSDKLVAAFYALKDAYQWIRDHLDAIITASKVFVGLWIGTKVASAIYSVNAAMQALAAGTRDAQIAAVGLKAALLGVAVVWTGYGMWRIYKGLHEISKTKEKSTSTIETSLAAFKERYGEARYIKLMHTAGIRDKYAIANPALLSQDEQLRVSRVLAKDMADLVAHRKAYEEATGAGYTAEGWLWAVQHGQSISGPASGPSLDIPINKLTDAVKKLHKHGIKVHIQVEKDRDYPDRVAVQVFDAAGHRMRHVASAGGYLVMER